MPDLTTAESIAVLRRILFSRLEETNLELTRGILDLTVRIDSQEHGVIALLLGEIENRIKVMRNIMAVLNEYP